jgi:hypothetical protein
MSDKSVLAAGTIVSFSTNLDTPSYTIIPKITNLGPIGLMSEAKENTTLADRQKTYGAGLQDAPDVAIKGQYIGSDSDQAAFRLACRNKQLMLIKVEFPDIPDGGTSGTQATYLVQTLGFQMDEPNGEEWLMFSVNGKQNTAPVWVDPV